MGDEMMFARMKILDQTPVIDLFKISFFLKKKAWRLLLEFDIRALVSPSIFWGKDFWGNKKKEEISFFF